MHPAYSIIVFTVASGLGYGLAAILGLGLLNPDALATKVAHLAALALIGGGLLSSTLHLGNPQRAWRAFSQWRSSWLSREGVMTVATFLPLLCSAGASIVWGAYWLPSGLAGTILSFLTVYCTSMIYASLRSVDAWHTPLTSLCYILFAIAGGLIAANALTFASDMPNVWLAPVGIVALLAGWSAKLFWWRRLATQVPTSTPETATGLGFIGRVRQFERPHINDNYLTREMGFVVARRHAVKLVRIAVLLGGILPGVILLAVIVTSATGVPAVAMAALALLSHLVGMLVERWLFFAQARHAVMNYYGG